MLDMQFMDFVRGDMARHDEDAFGNPMYGQAPSSLPSPSYPGSPLRSPNLMPPANSPFVPTHSAPKLSPRPATSAQALAHVLACKQNLYDSIGALIMTAQAIGAPLADEWSVIPEDEWPQKHTSRPCLGTALEPMGVRISLLRQQVAMVRGSLEQLSLALRILLDFSPSATRQSRRVMSRRHNFDGAHDMTRDSRAPSTMSMRLGSVPARPAEFKGAKKARMMKMSVRPSIDKAHRFFGEPTPGTPSDAGADRDSRVPPPSIGHSAGLSGYGSISAPSPTAKTRPWFLSCDNESEIVWEEKDEATLIKLGTLQGLVEQLTRHDKLDTSFLSAFLLTYRSFTTATELLEHLMHRFTLPPPSGLPTSELELWAKMKQSPIRIRVVNTLKTWLENYWMEPSDDAPDGPTTRLLRSIQTFVRDAVIQTKTPGGPQLLALVEKRLRIGMEGKEQQITMSRKMTPHIKSAPAPLWPKNVKRIKLLDINPEEMARQLSLIEIKLYTRIKPTECLNKTWTKKSRNPDDTDLYAPNIKAMIKHSNQLTNWVAETILRQNDVKRRVAVIKFFTNVADRCGKMNNYSSLMTIISALATAPIDRLGRTWYQVSARTMAILERMRTLMQTTKNFALYRQTLHNVNPPCIPFLGIYLTDLIFTEDGIASRPDVPSAPDVKWINFSKWRKTAAVIQEIQQFQNGTYQFQPVPELQEWIMQQMRDAQDCSTKAAYDRSLEIEPREREDEKITRLLSESGFL
ncbi:hypothetical protein KEM52_000528 [Ascosphaera acerosa]|nr:hypothetical protein KEM52_000528 [Ascosphaera acerosa]